MMRFLAVIFGLLYITVIPLPAQQGMEDFLEETPAGIETDYQEILEDLSQNPVNARRASVIELLRIPFLDRQQARAIVEFRRKKPLNHLQDLSQIPGFSEELLTAISPYLRFQDLPAPLRGYYRINIKKALHSLRGFQERIYGNPYYVSHTLRWRQQRGWYGGFLWEKDAGENNWADYGSFHLGFKSADGNHHLLAGDFTINTGQGLVLSQGFSTAAIANRQPFTRPLLRFSPKSGFEENAFLRGILLSTEPRPWLNITLFYSRSRRDATQDSLTGHIKTLVTSGYHRTATEVSRKDLLLVSTAGSVLQLNFSPLRAGLLITRSDFRPSFRSTKGFFNTSLMYQSLSGAATLAGEISLSQLGSGQQHSLFINLEEPELMWGLLLYRYSPGTVSIHGRKFGSRSQMPENQQGYFLSLGFKKGKWQLATYLQIRQQLRDTATLPGKNMRYRSQLILGSPGKRIILRHTYRLSGVSNRHRWQLDFHFRPAPFLQIRQRISTGKIPVHKPPKAISGFLDFRLRLKRFRSQFRWTQFDIHGGEDPIYEVESELPGRSRIAIFTGQGTRWFLQISWMPVPEFRATLIYRSAVYPGLTRLGSGLDMVSGNHRQEIAFQFQYDIRNREK